METIKHTGVVYFSNKMCVVHQLGCTERVGTCEQLIGELGGNYGVENSAVVSTKCWVYWCSLEQTGLIEKRQGF